MVPKFISEAGGGEHELVILRTQFGVLLLFLLAVANTFLNHFVFALLSVFLFALNFVSVKTLSKQEKLFFLGLSVFGVVINIINSFSFIFLAGYFGSLIIFLLGFFLLYKRDFTFGKVLASSSKWACVQCSYDLLSGTKHGYFVVRTKKKLKEGGKVKVKTKSVWGERKPWSVVSS